MRPVADLPKLDSSTIAAAAANDATTGILFLDTQDGSFSMLINESSARDLYYELAVFLGYEER
jgi:hypothetical protein